MEYGQHHPVAARTDAGARARDQGRDDRSACPMRGHAARHQQGLRSLWAQTLGAPMWRSVVYGVLSLPAGVVWLLLALVGAHRASARLQRGLADRWLHLPLPHGGDRWGQVITHALLTSMLGVLCWLLVALAGPNTARNVLLYPITDGDDVARAAVPTATGSGHGRRSWPGLPMRPGWRSPCVTCRRGPPSGTGSSIGRSARSR